MTSEERALEFLREPRTCTELGEHLWHAANTRKVNRQSYARPAGKLLARLKKAGKVRRIPSKAMYGYWEPDRWMVTRKKEVSQ